MIIECYDSGKYDWFLVSLVLFNICFSRVFLLLFLNSIVVLVLVGWGFRSLVWLVGRWIRWLVGW